MALPPPETCSECGKSISGRALAHVWEGERIVCTKCRRKLVGQERQRQYWEGVESRRDLSPTDRQLEFAMELGFKVPPGITRGELSDLIDEALAERGDYYHDADDDD